MHLLSGLSLIRARRSGTCLVCDMKRPEAQERSSLIDTGRIFYRIIRSRQAALDDFKSAKSLGKPLRDRAHGREWEQGDSIFDSLEHARRRARAFKFALGRFVVAIRVPDDGNIEVAQTGNDRHHFTIYAEPEQLLSLVDGDAVKVQEIRMTTSFELMDLDSGNLVGSYRTLDEALEVVRNAYATYGQSGIDGLGLARVESSGSQECIAIGPELVDYAIDRSVSTQDSDSAATTDGSDKRKRARSRA